jgi:uncharacterized protein (DUF2164 family)
MTTHRAWDTLSKDEREHAIRGIVAYFQSERDEDIGVIAAGELLDFFLQTTGKNIYNQALERSRARLGAYLSGSEQIFDELMQV